MLTFAVDVFLKCTFYDCPSFANHIFPFVFFLLVQLCERILFTKLHLFELYNLKDRLKWFWVKVPTKFIKLQTNYSYFITIFFMSSCPLTSRKLKIAELPTCKSGTTSIHNLFIKPNEFHKQNCIATIAYVYLQWINRDTQML